MAVQHPTPFEFTSPKGKQKMVKVLLEAFISKVKSNDLGSWDSPIDLDDYIDN